MSEEESKFWSQFSTINDYDIPKLESSAALVVHLNGDSSLETRKFLLTKLKSHHLNLERIVSKKSDSCNDLFLVTCYETLILNHSKRVYRKQQLERQLEDDGNGDSLQNEDLTDSEKQRIIQDILEGIRVENKCRLVGMENVKCYSGQSLSMFLSFCFLFWM